MLLMEKLILLISKLKLKLTVKILLVLWLLSPQLQEFMILKSSKWMIWFINTVVKFIWMEPTWMLLSVILHQDIWELMFVIWTCIRLLPSHTEEEDQVWAQSVSENIWFLSYPLIHSQNKWIANLWEPSHQLNSVLPQSWPSVTDIFRCWASMECKEQQLMQFWMLITWWKSFANIIQFSTIKNLLTAVMSLLLIALKLKRTLKSLKKTLLKEWWISDSMLQLCPSQLQVL